MRFWGDSKKREFVDAALGRQKIDKIDPWAPKGRYQRSGSLRVVANLDALAAEGRRGGPKYQRISINRLKNNEVQDLTRRWAVGPANLSTC